MSKIAPALPAYPPPPWRLHGHAVQTVQLVDSVQARRFVPPALSIVRVLPGRTLGGVYLASYQTGSVLEYHELIVVAALVRAGRRIGVWISHIYVDEPRSVAGGREIWGLPKELATFEWERGAGAAAQPGHVVVRREGHVLCALDYRPRTWGARARLLLPAVSLRGPEVLSFVGDARAGVRLTGARVDVPPDSPFSFLGLGGRRVRPAIRYEDLCLRIPAPTVAGRRPA